MTSGTWGYCDECKETSYKNRKLKEVHIREDRYYVVNDPNKEYGYCKGASFYQREINWMLKACNHSLTPGTILRRGEELFKVVQTISGKQRLEKI